MKFVLVALALGSLAACTVIAADESSEISVSEEQGAFASRSLQGYRRHPRECKDDECNRRCEKQHKIGECKVKKTIPVTCVPKNRGKGECVSQKTWKKSCCEGAVRYKKVCHRCHGGHGWKKRGKRGNKRRGGKKKKCCRYVKHGDCSSCSIDIKKCECTDPYR